MANEQPAVPAGTVQVQNPAPSPATPAAPEPQKYVTQEQLNEYTRRLDGISASLRKLEPLATVVQQPQPAKEPDTLKSLKEQIDARDAKLTARERKAALTEALEAAGVPAERRAKAANYILAEHAPKMTQTDEGGFQYTENGEAQALHDWVQLYMKTDDGKFINPEPAPSVPTGKGLSGSKTTSAGAAHPGMKMSYKELMDAKNPALRASFAREHPEEWKAKQQEYFASR